jgi:hypothetical protein
MKILSVILVAFSLSACAVTPLTPVKVVYQVVKFPIDLVLD